MASVGCAVTRIGRIVPGEGVQVRAADGSAQAITMKGWEHFA
jgi:thiamine-monophosphate kinase